MPKFRWPLAPLPTLLLGLGAIVVILVGWRADVVRLLPQTASFYSVIGLGVNLRGLEFENIKTSREIHDGIPVMVVEGEIVSVSRKAVDVPRLRFGVRNGLGAEIYNWTAMPSRTIGGTRRSRAVPLAARFAAGRDARHQREILIPAAIQWRDCGSKNKNGTGDQTWRAFSLPKTRIPCAR